MTKRIRTLRWPWPWPIIACAFIVGGLVRLVQVGGDIVTIVTLVTLLVILVAIEATER